MPNENTTMDRVEEYEKAARILGHDHSDATALITTGMLIHDGLHAVAASIERVGDVEQPLGDVANAIGQLSDVGSAIEKIASVLESFLQLAGEIKEHGGLG